MLVETRSVICLIVIDDHIWYDSYHSTQTSSMCHLMLCMLSVFCSSISVCLAALLEGSAFAASFLSDVDLQRYYRASIPYISNPYTTMGQTSVNVSRRLVVVRREWGGVEEGREERGREDVFAFSGCVGINARGLEGG